MQKTSKTAVRLILHARETENRCGRNGNGRERKREREEKEPSRAEMKKDKDARERERERRDEDAKGQGRRSGEDGGSVYAREEKENDRMWGPLKITSYRLL